MFDPHYVKAKKWDIILGETLGQAHAKKAEPFIWPYFSVFSWYMVCLP